MTDIKKLKNEALREISAAKTLEALRNVEVAFLGRKSELTNFLRGLKSLPQEERVKIGKQANEIRQEINSSFEARKNELEREEFYEKAKQDKIDISEPGKPVKRGHLHPSTIIQNRLEDIFKSMGFMVLDGPELESEFFNFEALNIPADHPARDTQDTFWLDNGHLLRTHTSAFQVRAMQKYGVPIKAVVPGRVFRNEATDASHETTFYQMEGLVVGENISLANLISTMKILLDKIFERKVTIRVRPGYFPFTEPSLEIDVACLICGGEGCNTCKGRGWFEIIPGGLVHPNVLKAAGVDTKKYNGFAFGLGLTRLVMSKYGINDIRLLQSGDKRFLEQF